MRIIICVIITSYTGLPTWQTWIVSGCSVADFATFHCVTATTQAQTTALQTADALAQCTGVLTMRALFSMIT